MGFKVLIPQDITDAGKKYLLDRGYEIKMGSAYDVETISKEVRDCDAILARTETISAEVMKSAPKLKVIGRYGAGVDNIDLETATKLGIQVTNAPTANSNSVAEHTIGLILASVSNLVYIDRKTREGEWEIRNTNKRIEVKSKVLGLLGYGRIGKLVAEKAYYGLGMKIIAFDPYIDSVEESYVDFCDSVQDIYKKSDFISLHLPSTTNTFHMINEDAFNMMKNTAYLINCARGDIVDEKSLFDALKKNKIRGAALDTFENEPLDKNNPLLKLDNIIVSPHNAALTYEAMDMMGIHAAMGIDEVLSNKEPTWPVNKLRR